MHHLSKRYWYNDPRAPSRLFTCEEVWLYHEAVWFLGSWRSGRRYPSTLAWPISYTRGPLVRDHWGIDLEPAFRYAIPPGYRASHLSPSFKMLSPMANDYACKYTQIKQVILVPYQWYDDPPSNSFTFVMTCSSIHYEFVRVSHVLDEHGLVPTRHPPTLLRTISYTKDH